jgi:hypothetical protein
VNLDPAVKTLLAAPPRAATRPRPGRALCWCRSVTPGVTVTLHADVAAAETAKRLIDRLACGSRCTGAHFLFRLGPAEGGR